jgi:ferredoxin
MTHARQSARRGRRGPSRVAGSCIKDDSCIEVCPVDCIHPKPGDPDFEAAEQLYIDPELCIDCDACVEACTIDVIFADFELPLVTGDGGFTMWRRPGYGDFLAQRDPGIRERQASGGAPEGFEDAVAWLVRMTADQFPEDTPPHWSTTFAVDDADEIAERAAELGGKVLAPPFDAPYVRMTVLSDPQGAVFTASKYMPPN